MRILKYTFCLVVFLLSQIPPSKVLADGPRYLDVRTYSERRMEHIPHSLHIPLAELPNQLASLKPYQNAELVTVCRSGVRSKKAQELLQKNGFSQVSSFSGGIVAWEEKQLPLNGMTLNTPAAHYDQTVQVGLLLQKIVYADEENPTPGLRVYGVLPGGAAEQAGILFGDTITHIGPKKITVAQLKTQNSYYDFFAQDHLKLPLQLTLERNQKIYQVKLPRQSFDHLMNADDLPKRSSATLALDKVKPPPFQKALHEKYPALERAFQTRVKSWGAMALPIVRAALSHPEQSVKLEALATPRLANTQSPGEILLTALDFAAGQFSVKASKKNKAKLPQDLKQLLDQIEATLKQVQSHSAMARVSLSDSEIKMLQNHVVLALKIFTQSMFLQDVAEDKIIEQMHTLRRLSQKVKYERLIQAAALLGRLSSPEFSRQLQVLAENQKARPESQAGPVTRDTPLGKILIGGSGNDRYREGAAVIIDLGGDDSYEFDAFGWPQLVIDVSGRDTYFTKKGKAGVPDLFTVKLLYDLAGDDVYRGDSHSNAFATFGVAMQVDAAGNDQYDSGNFSLGSALFGIGILVDHQGNDRYVSKVFSQGFGGVSGVGMLIDVRGDDQYNANAEKDWRHVESSFSQGVGAGFPYYTSGGYGALIDLQGQDKYQGLNYSQGVGYYGGFGMLFDGLGDDQFAGGKFSQGAGVHGAIGFLSNQSGNDRYHSSDFRAQGVGYDLGIGYLHDRGGQDTYYAVGQAQAFSAQNGFSLFWDEGGPDQFLCDLIAECGGKTGQNFYEAGRDAGSLSLFFTDASVSTIGPE